MFYENGDVFSFDMRLVDLKIARLSLLVSWLFRSDDVGCIMTFDFLTCFTMMCKQTRQSTFSEGMFIHFHFIELSTKVTPQTSLPPPKTIKITRESEAAFKKYRLIHYHLRIEKNCVIEKHRHVTQKSIHLLLLRRGKPLWYGEETKIIKNQIKEQTFKAVITFYVKSARDVNEIRRCNVLFIDLCFFHLLQETSL